MVKASELKQINRTVNKEMEEIFNGLLQDLDSQLRKAAEEGKTECEYTLSAFRETSAVADEHEHTLVNLGYIDKCVEMLVEAGFEVESLFKTSFNLRISWGEVSAPAPAEEEEEFVGGML